MKEKETGIRIEERDVAILTGLLEHRVLSSVHIAELYFAGKPEATKKRLQKLKSAGLIAERPRKPYEVGVLYLKKPGLVLLRERGVLQNYPKLDLPVLERRAKVSPTTIAHELEVMDVKVAFHKALRRSSKLTLVEFSTWPLLYQFQSNGLRKHRDVLVKPDGFIRIHEKEEDGSISEHAFFLEVDRSTETQDSLVSRAVCYLDFFKSGGFALRHRAPRTAYKEYPFRVLFVLKSAPRRDNLADRLLNNTPPILRLTYLSIISEVTTNPIDAIWLLPIEQCEQVEAKTRNGAPNRTPQYVRQGQLDIAVKRTHRLLPLI